MIKYIDIEQTLASRSVFFDTKEYLFALSVVLGEDKDVAYAITFKRDEYKKVKGTEEEKDFFASCATEISNLEQQQHFKQLVEELKYQYRKSVQDAALHLEDIEITSSDVKKVLASFLRDRIDDPSSASVKELVDLLKMYQPYLPDDANASDFQRHFIQIHEPYNALCTNCNHEINAFKGLSCVCEHCGQKYIWEDDRFYPAIDKL